MSELVKPLNLVLKSDLRLGFRDIVFAFLSYSIAFNGLDRLRDVAEKFII
jgi:hypothetical protein